MIQIGKSESRERERERVWESFKQTGKGGEREKRVRERVSIWEERQRREEQQSWTIGTWEGREFPRAEKEKDRKLLSNILARRKTFKSTIFLLFISRNVITLFRSAVWTWRRKNKNTNRKEDKPEQEERNFSGSSNYAVALFLDFCLPLSDKHLFVFYGIFVQPFPPLSSKWKQEKKNQYPFISTSWEQYIFSK